MTQHSSGLLPALIDYYRRLERDPSQKVAEFGFSVEKIHFVIVLERDGTLYSFEDIRDRRERGKPAPKSFLVPFAGGRQGIGLKPFFCWDNTGYALGRDNKDNPGRATEMFAAFRDLHLSFRDELANDDGFAALCRFLESWNPERAETLPNWDEAAGQNVVFKLRARERYIHQSEAVQKAWSQSLDRQSEDGKRVLGESLVSGEVEELARLHPHLKGVSGANTMGAAIVSFDKESFRSYGKSQSYNAPVGTLDAFRYTTALNRLLADDSRKVRIGDATVVFWSGGEEGTDAESIFQACFGENFAMSEDAEHGATVARVQEFLSAARLGRLSDQIQDPDAPFYILGLSPNKSRLSIRYWLVGTVRQFAERLARHVADLEMTGARPNDPPLIIRRLLLETVRDPKDIAPQLAGEVARAVLSGLPYPQALFNAIVRRVRADSVMNHRRAAILKAFLIRNRDEMEDVPVSLDKNYPDEAYHLGRLFAAIEFAQTNALGDLNRSVKDAYFGAAAATPAIVFPRLVQLHQYHLEKLPTGSEEARREKKRSKGFFERLVQEVCSHIRQFPPYLPLERQGLFHIGYYHQRQDFFTKKTEKDQEATDE